MPFFIVCDRFKKDVGHIYISLERRKEKVIKYEHEYTTKQKEI